MKMYRVDRSDARFVKFEECEVLHFDEKTGHGCVHSKTLGDTVSVRRATIMGMTEVYEARDYSTKFYLDLETAKRDAADVMRCMIEHHKLALENYRASLESIEGVNNETE